VTGNSFVYPRAFDIALQNLYGLALVTDRQLASEDFLTLGYERTPAAGEIPVSSGYAARMDFALCYAASGAFLVNCDILRAGMDLAEHALHWENLETAFRFGLAPGSFAIVSHDSVLPSPTRLNGSENNDNSEHDDGMPNKSAPSYSYHSAYTLNHEFDEIWAPKMLQSALEFVVDNFPPDFELDTEAQPTVMPDRFPEVVGMTHAYISTLKFGKFSASAHSRESTLLSAIMLSLPFKCLRKLFTHMRSKRRLPQKIAEDVVAERERRRARALRVFKAERGEAACDDALLPEALGWEESVQVSDGTSYGPITLVTTWRGSTTRPLVFGPESD
jgi:hypothetical protein